MEYIVEISNMQGEDVAEGDFSLIESSDPIPIANVGDHIIVNSGGGPDFKQAQELKVIRREFNYIPEFGDLKRAVRVQLFCQDASKD